MENEPTPELSYDSPRDEALHRLWDAGWANESSGEEGSATGPFARVSNSEEELPGLQREFGEQWQSIGAEPAEMLGHFLLGRRTAEQRGVVLEFPDERGLLAAFNELKRQYQQRKGDTNSE